MMLEILGKADGLCAGKGGSMHIADLQHGMLGANAIVGGSPPLVIGAALTAKTLKSVRVAVAFTGDGGSNQGTVFEAMNMAVVLQLPAIFVIENNGYGEGTAVEYAVGAKDVAKRGAGFGMPAVAVDGTDFFAVYDVMAAAVTRARAGGGPSFIEARCVRIHGHYCGDPQTYRSKEELAQAREVHDPITAFRRRVLASGQLTSAELDSIDRSTAEEMDAVVSAAHSGSVPAVETLYTDVYSTY
jgi:pyruvate dehydrogenase E1 component alpha subunit